jgi:serine/threonine-protein kinase HipA
LPNGKAQQEDFCQLSNRTAELHGENYKYDGSYEEMGELIKKYVAAPAVALERFFKLVVFNYLVCNGDAHLKNFSLIMRDKQTQEYMLAPAYDLLNTHLHVPNERRTALELFKDDFQTVSYELNGFYAYDDFAELARRLGLIEKRYQKSLEDCLEKQEAVFSLIDRSLLSEECKHDYKEDVKDRIKALSLSHAK